MLVIVLAFFAYICDTWDAVYHPVAQAPTQPVCEKHIPDVKVSEMFSMIERVGDSVDPEFMKGYLAIKDCLDVKFGDPGIDGAAGTATGYSIVLDPKENSDPYYAASGLAHEIKHVIDHMNLLPDNTVDECYSYEERAANLQYQFVVAFGRDKTAKHSSQSIWILVLVINRYM